jgi:hypothetical protein
MMSPAQGVSTELAMRLGIGIVMNGALNWSQIRRYHPTLLSTERTIDEADRPKLEGPLL